VAFVARARRELLLRVHARRLRREDLEDCYSQAILELLAHARTGGSFSNRRHIANAIEQRFVSRIHDRRRAVSGRSPMQAALEQAIRLDAGELDGARLVDPMQVEQLVLLRQQLQLIRASVQKLTREQQMVLACQISLQMDSGEFCRLHGWSSEKYRKVAQRARGRLRLLVNEAEAGVPASPRGSEQNSGTDL